MVSCCRRAAGWRLQRTFSPNLLPRRMCRPTHTAGHSFPPSTILKIGAAMALLHRAVSRAGYTHIRRPGVSYGYVAWRCSAEPVRRGFGSRALHQRRRRRAAGLEIDPPVDSDPLANAVQCARFARSASAVGMRGCPKRWHGNSNHSRCGAGYLMRGWAGWGRPACIRYRVRPSPAIVGGSCWQSAWHTACLGAPQPATAAPWRPCWPRRGGARRG